MTFLQPWIFLGFVPVAAAALLALFRPRRNLVIVGSLWLWSEAISAAASSDSRRRRRTPPAWWLLLLGACAAVLAGTRPAYRSSGPIRHVALALHPSAELGPEGIAEMRLACRRLLDRLDSADRIELLEPEMLAADAEKLSPDQVRASLAGIRRLPVSARRLDVSDRPDHVDRTYHLATAGCDIASGPEVKRIDISTHLPAVSIDAVGAEKLAADKLQLFVALRNNTERSVSASVEARDVLGSRSTPMSVTLAAGARKPVALTMAPAEAVEVSVRVGGTGSHAYLVRVKTPARSVAIVGRDDPYIRRLIEVDPSLRLTADQKDADVVIANHAAAPAGKPALVIAPPSPPAGWSPADRQLSSVIMSDADIASDDPIMRGVDLKTSAIRRSESWIRGDRAEGTVLVGYKGAALVVRSNDDADASGPRRVHLAFDLSESNCTLVRSEAYVVFVANVIRSLTPGSFEPEKYQCRSPLQTGLNPAWKRIAGDESFDEPTLSAAGLTSPGVYRDAGGKLHAVSLLGLKSSRAAMRPEKAIGEIELPAPRISGQPMELWSILLVAAGLLWLAGWCVGALKD